jgi:hypothetical protein
VWEKLLALGGAANGSRKLLQTGHENFCKLITKSSANLSRNVGKAIGDGVEGNGLLSTHPVVGASVLSCPYTLYSKECKEGWIISKRAIK